MDLMAGSPEAVSAAAAGATREASVPLTVVAVVAVDGHRRVADEVLVVVPADRHAAHAVVRLLLQPAHGGRVHVVQQRHVEPDRDGGGGGVPALDAPIRRAALERRRRTLPPPRFTRSDLAGLSLLLLLSLLLFLTALLPRAPGLRPGASFFAVPLVAQLGPGVALLALPGLRVASFAIFGVVAAFGPRGAALVGLPLPALHEPVSVLHQGHIGAEEGVELPQRPAGGPEIWVAAGAPFDLGVLAVPGDGEEPRVQVPVGVARLAQQGPGDHGEHVSLPDADQVPQEAAPPPQGEQRRLDAAVELGGQRGGPPQDQAGVTGLPLGGAQGGVVRTAGHGRNGS
ncbi:hypothetical protein EYF80_054256 [Liparis tanakae]|uniref:Uncharacterized protein n=1 Tax=Liparis tanakae TaxID=230148 RepID=A0A4Z2F3W9_9TELE|nr:hypothetical protein EYF80_054256 [Liparis tanakae]